MAYDPNVDYREVARRKAIKYGLDPDIFVRQIGVESVGYDPGVISGRTNSPAGAQGIAQIMPATARGWGINPLKPRVALDAAARHMAEYVKQYGSYEDALRAYNAGPGAIQASHGYAETNNYVQQILHGHDPGQLGQPRTPGRGGGNRNRPQGGGDGQPTIIPGQPPQSAGLGPLAASGATDVASLASLLRQAPQPQAVTPIAPPEFSASRFLPQNGMPVASRQPQAPSDDIRAQLATLGTASVGLSAPARPGRAGTQTRVVGGGPSGPANVPSGRTLVIGDSLEVGTFPLLKQKLGNRVKGVAVGGKSSSWGIRQLRREFQQGKYANVVFDLGTNDASVGELRQSLAQLTKIAGGAKVFVSTVNSPFDEGAKNRLLRTYARNHPNVELIRWHGASHGGADLADGIHGDYDKRAGLLANALGYQQPRPQTGGTSRFPTRKVEGVMVTAPKTAWNPEANPMAPWMAQALDWAHRHGWTGTVSSGYRTHDEQQAAAERYGLSHYGPGGPQASNHRTGNAVDVTNAEQLAKVLRGYRGGKRPIWAGPTIGDWVHFSDNGH